MNIHVQFGFNHICTLYPAYTGVRTKPACISPFMLPLFLYLLRLLYHTYLDI